MIFIIFSTCAFFHDSLNDSRISHTKLLFQMFAKSCPQVDRHGRWLLVRTDLEFGHPHFCHVSVIHRPQYLSVMKAMIQFLDFRYLQFELTCWSAYSNHTKDNLCTLFILPIPYSGIVDIPAHDE